MCDEPFLCADATELPNHPALRRALKLRDACRICWEPRLFCIGGLLSGYEKRNILPGIIKNENIMCLDNNLRSDGIVGKNTR